MQVVLCSPALASDWAPDTDRILGDPAFLPLRGQVSGSFAYDYTASRYDSQNGDLSSWHSSQNSFLPALSYGITDDVSVSANLGWGNVRSQGSAAFPDFSTYKYSYHSLGAQNPGFGLTWRAVDQRSTPVNFDLAVGYAPDIFTARDPGGENTGTIAQGGQRATLEGSVSREMRLLTVRGYATFGYDGRSNVLQPGGFEVDRVGAHPDYAIGVQGEARILPWLALNAGVGAQISTRFDRQFISPFGRVSQTVSPGGAVSP